MSEKQLQGKVALITGTSPNIGGGIAEGLAEVGAKVVCVDIYPENAKQCAAAIVKRGGQAIADANLLATVERADDHTTGITENPSSALRQATRSVGEKT